MAGCKPRPHPGPPPTGEGGYALCLVFLLWTQAAYAEKNVLSIGREQVQPGMDAEFRAEAPDIILPDKVTLGVKQSDIFLLAAIRWDGSKGPQLSGVVPGLSVLARITNESIGKSIDYLLSPHISVKDGPHYARNVKLPGVLGDDYTVSFIIEQPRPGSMLYRSDWAQAHEAKLLMEPKTFTYKNINFSGISPRLQ